MTSNDRNAAIVLAGGFILLAVSFGARISFGVYLPTMPAETGFTIASLSLVLAVQNLIWGAAQPFAGRLSDRFGAAPVVFAGGVLYAGGLAITAYAENYYLFGLSAGVILGIAQAAIGFPVVLGAIGRTATDKYRGLFLGIATAGGSFGQLAFSPLSNVFLTNLGLVDSFLAMGAICLAAATLATLVRRESRPTAEQMAAASSAPGQTLREVLGRAMSDRSFQLLIAGFFVCGFHLAFIAVHLPNFAIVCGLSAGVGTAGLAIIGASNIVGTIVAGQLGGKFRPKYPLSIIYALRGVAALSLLFIPVTETVLIIFSIVIGLLWLSTVPLTSLTVAKLHGPANVGMLFGIVFFSHQVGSFVGLVMAGEFYEMFGNYDAMWIASALLGAFAAIVHLPIEDNRQLQPA
ncbi:MAG: MFS transporter [Alphaproteobacteria bacterium]